MGGMHGAYQSGLASMKWAIMGNNGQQWAIMGNNGHNGHNGRNLVVPQGVVEAKAMSVLPPRRKQGRLRLAFLGVGGKLVLGRGGGEGGGASASTIA
jgi:hypothetical protein